MTECSTWQIFQMENFGKIYRSPESNERIVWSVPNCLITLPMQKRQGLYVTSPSFSLKGCKWQLIVKEERGYLGLFLWMLDCKSVKPKYEITLGLKSHDSKANSVGFVDKSDSYLRFGKWDFANMGILNRCRDIYHPNGFLDFFCEITRIKVDDVSLPNEVSPSLHEDSIVEEEQNDESKTQDDDTEISPEVSVVDAEENDEPETEGLDRLVQNFKKLLLDGQNSDLTLKVENREFLVHRLILSVRSPVFASMLEHDMAEKRDGVVDIADCSAEAFEVFLLYLYTGSADTMDQQNVFNLYYAADKYSVNDLKKDCVQFMKNTLSVDTFCDVITLSLRHGESELQKVATRFFCENMKKIIKTVQWQKYIQEHPIPANELYIKAVNA